MDVADLTIPVPWGHISGKTWGDRSHPPVLCLHGIIDNCNSFDRLIPLLPSCFFYICLDLPGHGLSSHFPTGFTNNGFVFVSSVARAVQHLRLDKFALMGHSFGARIGSFYASLFPEKITKLIMLDSFGFPYNAPHEARDQYKASLLIPFKVEHARATKTQPKYKYEDLLQRLIAGRRDQHSCLTREAAQLLMARNIKKIPNEDLYYYTIDQHLKYYNSYTPVFTRDQLKHIFSNFKFRVIILESSESHGKHNTTSFVDLKSIWKNTLGAEIVLVEGNHDVHLNEPHRVSKYVAPFLLDAGDGDVGKSKL